MRKLPFPLLHPWVRWAGVVLVAAVIFYLSVITAPPEQPIVPGGPPDFLPLDKWRHFLAYAAFGGSLAYATADWDWGTPQLVALVLVVTAGYGVGIELIQATLPQRYFGLGDAYANVAGGVLVLPWFAVQPYLRFVAVPGDLVD